jgi:hypothetical protein
MQSLLLFAQQNKFGQQQPAGGGDAAAAGGMMFLFFCLYGVILIASIVVSIMFLLSLSRCLKAIKPRNRTMEPGQVWLCLIPIFGTVWIIITILRISESLEAEYEDRGWSEDGDFAKMTGILYIVLSFVCGPVGLIFWIMYWMKIAGYTRALNEGRGGGGDGGGRRSRARDDEDDEDDRPRRRRRDDEDDDDR